MRDYEDKREGRQIIFGWIFVVSSIVLIVSVFISILFLTLSKSEGA